MFFITLILLTALLMEAIGTYVSIVGFGMTFHHDLVIMAVAAVLDAAKLVTVSFLYQYWEEVKKKLMTSVMIFSSVFLMLITSAGIYGYFVKNFQESTQGNLETSIELKTLNLEIDRLQADVETWTKQKLAINKQIEQLPADKVAERQRLLWSFRNELNLANKNLSVAQDELKTKLAKRTELQKEEVKREVALGPVAYTAKVFGVSYEAAVNWLIMLIVFVFDPLAVMLVLSANFLIKRRRSKTPTIDNAEAPALVEKRIFVEPSRPVDTTVTTSTVQADSPVRVSPMNAEIIKASNQAEGLSAAVKREQKKKEPTLPK